MKFIIFKKNFEIQKILKINLNLKFKIFLKGADAAEIRKRENQMKSDLDDFRNNVCKALLFINLCFFVFSVTMKAFSDELPKATIGFPISFLSWGQARVFITK